MDVYQGDMLTTVAKPRYGKRALGLIVALIIILVVGALLSDKPGRKDALIEANYPVTKVGKYTVYYEGTKPDVAPDLEKIINHPSTRIVFWADRIAPVTYVCWRWTRENGIQRVDMTDLG
jgi:hypothetical protein